MGKYQDHIAGAELGDKVDQFEVGYAYLTGDGVERDYQKAYDWFERSDKNYYSHAALEIGNMFQYGVGRNQDTAGAKFWYEKARERGNILAFSILNEPDKTPRPFFFDQESRHKSRGFITDSLAKLNLIRTPVNECCFIEAVSTYLNEDPSVFSSKLAAQIESNQEKYRALLQDPSELQAHIEGLKAGKGGDGKVEIEAIQDMTRSQLFIVTSVNKPDQYLPDPAYQSFPIYVYYNHHGHYDAFKPRDNCTHDSLLRVKEKYLPKQEIVLPREGAITKLFQLIDKCEEEHTKLYNKIEKGGVETFKRSSFEERMAYTGYKQALALLYLAAAGLAKKHECMGAYGKFAYLSYSYNPLLQPNLSYLENLTCLPGVDRHKDLKDLLYISSIFIGIAPGCVAAFFISLGYLFSSPAILLVNLSVIPASQSAYAKHICEEDISIDFSSSDCFALGLAHLSERNFFMAVRYFLEANQRSEVHMAEISDFIRYAIRGVGINYQIPTLIHAREPFISTINSMKVFVKREGLVQNSSDRFEMDSRSELFELAYRAYGKYGLSKGDYYYLKIPELSKQIRSRFINTFQDLLEYPPEYAYSADYPNDRTYQSTNDNLTHSLPTREILAYLSLLAEIPKKYIHMGLASQDASQSHPEAEAYLYQKLNVNSDTELVNLKYSLPNIRVQLEDEYEENLLLLIVHEVYHDCESLQEKDPGKYWHYTHTKISEYVDIKQMPLNLRNPFVFIKSYIDKQNDETKKLSYLFLKLTARGGDLSEKLKNAKTDDVQLNSMIECLNKLELTKVQGFIDEYHQYYKDPYTQNLLQLLRSKDVVGCAQLQDESVSKYWFSLHININGSGSAGQIDALPILLKNPLIYLKDFLAQCRFIDNERDRYFEQLVSPGCDLKQHLSEAHRFSGFSAIEKKRQRFYAMISTLQRLHDHDPELLIRFTQAYHEQYPPHQKIENPYFQGI